MFSKFGVFEFGRVSRGIALATLGKRLALGVSLAGLVACATTAESPVAHYPLLVGTYTAGTSQGIYRFDFDSQSGTLATQPKQVVVTPNPSWLTLSKDQRLLYAVNENGPGQADPVGRVTTFAIDPVSKNLQLRAYVGSEGDEPTYSSLSGDERYLFVANYAVHPNPGGSLAVLPIGRENHAGAVTQQERHPASHVDKERQASSHVHSVVSAPDGQYVFVSDLGADRLFVYRYDPSNTAKPLTPAPVPEVVLPPGSGPRHLVFSADGRHAYLTTEMSEQVVAFDYRDGQLQQQQMLSLKAANGLVGGGGGLHLSPDGRFLYVANRGSVNELVVFAVDANTGALHEIQRRSVEGREPREFSLDPSGNFMLIANQKSSEIVIVHRDAHSGLLGTTVQKLATDTPSDLKFLRP